MTDAALAQCGLFLIVENFEEGDELEVTLNGSDLPWSCAKVNFDGWNRWRIESNFWDRYPTYPIEEQVEGTGITFPLDGSQLRQGDNQIGVTALSNKSNTGRITLTDIQISINYK